MSRRCLQPNNQPRDAIRAVRDWLSSNRTTIQMPGGKAIYERYEGFRAQLPIQASAVRLDYKELTFGDYTAAHNSPPHRTRRRTLDPCYRPRHTGLRFSMKAFSPSFASCVFISSSR